jgi:hypothetical protein
MAGIQKTSPKEGAQAAGSNAMNHVTQHLQKAAATPPAKPVAVATLKGAEVMTPPKKGTVV